MKKIDLACIIDDDPIFIFGAKRIMEIADFCNGYLIYHNGKEAIDALSSLISNNQSLPEVILLDINMPVMDGWQFLDEFIKIDPPKEITIYIISSSIDPSDVQRAKSYERVSKYLIKPITVDKLRTILLEASNTEN